MNRQERRKLAATHHKFTARLPQREKETNPVKLKFLSDLAKYGTREIAYGVFGPETRSSDGYIEEVLTPASGGTFLKLYGCSYLFKGHSTTPVVQGIQLSKSLFSAFLRELARMPFAAIGFGLSFLFTRKRFLKFADFALSEIDQKVTQYYGHPETEYNEMPQEICRALTEAAIGEGIYEPIFAKLGRFVRLFFQEDNTYRFRIQDAFGGTNPEGGAPEFLKRLKVMQDRETGTGIPQKWRFIRVVLGLAIITSPALGRILERFVRILDTQKVKMDESDWYFSLTFRSYDFGGLSYDERSGLRQLADRQKGHVFFL